MLKYHQADFSLFKHLVVPVLGTVLMLFPLWGVIQPGQPYPFNFYPYIVLALFILSLIYGALLTNRAPDLVQRIGSYVADEEF
jgi:hypothetical protein